MKRIILSALLAATLSATAMAQKTVVSNERTEKKVYDTSDVLPEFAGEEGALFAFLSQNIRYPKQMMEQQVQGVVIVSFVVEADGTVTTPTVRKGISPELDAEAVRVVLSMPKWKPGMQDGEPVAVKFTLPIRFQLTTPAKQ